MNLEGIPRVEIINRSQKNIVLGDDADNCYAPSKVKDEQRATQKMIKTPRGCLRYITARSITIGNDSY